MLLQVLLGLGRPDLCNQKVAAYQIRAATAAVGPACGSACAGASARAGESTGAVCERGQAGEAGGQRGAEVCRPSRHRCLRRFRPARAAARGLKEDDMQGVQAVLRGLKYG